MVGRSEDYGSGNEILGRCSGKILGAWLAFGHCHVFGGADKLSELCVRHVCLVHEKPIDIHAVNRPRVGRSLHTDFIHVGWVVGTHGEFTAWNPNHALRSLAWGLIVICYGRAERQSGVWGRGLGRTLSIGKY